MKIRYYFFVLISIYFSLSRKVEASPNPMLLESSAQTDNDGVWYPWSNCPEGQYVSAVNLKIDQVTNSGLNGLKLYCAGPAHESSRYFISSSVGSNGRYTGHQTCADHGFASGFQLKSDFQHGRGINNIMFFCNNGGSDLTYRPNLNSSWGNWTDRQDCPEDHAICGIQTQVLHQPQSVGGRGGKTRNTETSGLRNIKFECCQVTAACDPVFSEELIFQYDNRNATTSHTEFYSETNGYGSQTSESHSEDTFKQTRHISGVSAGAILKLISFRISHTLDKASETYSKWSRAVLTVESKVETFSRTIVVPPGMMVQIFQPVVSCYGFVVKNKFVRRVDIPADENANKSARFLAMEDEIRNLRLQLQFAEQAEQECSRKLNETEDISTKDNEINSVFSSLINALG